MKVIKMYSYPWGYIKHAPEHEGVWESRTTYTSIILELGARWRSAVSLTLLLLYPCGNNPLYSMYRRLSGPRSGLDFMEKQKYLSFTGNLSLTPLSSSP
jgi:hypothetical protein